MGQLLHSAWPGSGQRTRLVAGINVGPTQDLNPVGVESAMVGGRQDDHSVDDQRQEPSALVEVPAIPHRAERPRGGRQAGEVALALRLGQLCPGTVNPCFQLVVAARNSDRLISRRW
jgi:hypothetical protein